MSLLENDITKTSSRDGGVDSDDGEDELSITYLFLHNRL